MKENMHLQCQQIIDAAERDCAGLIYAMSHDVRAPLRHIDGFLALFRRRVEAQLDAESRQYLDKIAQASSRMTRMIDDLRTYARETSADLNRVPVPLDVLVRSVIEAASRSEGAADIAWEVGDLPVAWADRDLLRCALDHVIRNAVHYTRHRDKPRIGITAMERDNNLELCVEDNGEGFDIKYAGNLFKLFHRLHADHAPDGSGTGLAAVARIVGRHGGRVWAEGVAGEGAKFFLSLPAKIPSAP